MLYRLSSSGYMAWLGSAFSRSSMAARRLNKKLSKSKRNVIKVLRKKNKKIRRYFKRMTKKYFKIKRKAIKSFRKRQKKLRRYLKRTNKVSIYSLALTLCVVGSITLGVAYAQQRLLSSPEVMPSKQVTGPTQSNSLFSVYPAWSQNFAAYGSSQLNSSDWEVSQGPAQNSNNEAEYYTNNPANIRIANGALTLEATQQPEPQNYNYASARIDTSGKKSFLYGRIDVTAKIPNGVGTWPAVWLLPANNVYEDLSPVSDSTRYVNGGEIDMIEAVGVNPNAVFGVIHDQSDFNLPGGNDDAGVVTIPNNNTNYNLYSLLWTPKSITFEVNNKAFYSYDRPEGANYTTWPFDQPFYLILNLALGGTWGGMDTSQYPPNGIDNSILPASMQIRSIYYYPYVGHQVTGNN